MRKNKFFACHQRKARYTTVIVIVLSILIIVFCVDASWITAFKIGDNIRNCIVLLTLYKFLTIHTIRLKWAGLCCLNGLLAGYFLLAYLNVGFRNLFECFLFIRNLEICLEFCQIEAALPFQNIRNRIGEMGFSVSFSDSIFFKWLRDCEQIALIAIYIQTSKYDLSRIILHERDPRQRIGRLDLLVVDKHWVSRR